MKKMILVKWMAACALLAAVLASPSKAAAQKVRVYASSSDETTSLGGSVGSASQAYDGDPTTASSLGVAVVGAASQKLIFSSVQNAGTTVYLKFGTSTSILGITGLTAQVYNGGSAVGSSINLSTAVTLLDGGNQYEAIITPSGNFNAIQITKSGVSVGGNIAVYEAYYYNTPGTAVGCNMPVDGLAGVNSAGLGSLINAVTSSPLATDGNFSTYSTLNATVGVLAYTQQTVLYPGASTATDDSVRITFSVPSALASVAALASSLTLLTYNGTTLVDQVTNNTSLLNVRLLSNGTSPSVIAFKPTGAFDRVEVRLGGTLSVLSALNIHEIERVTPTPTVSSATASPCNGSPATLQATGSSNTVLQWFINQVGGLLQGTGSPFVTSNIASALNYYVEAKHTGCSNASDRRQVAVTPLPLPLITTVALPNAVAGVPYSSQLVVTNGTPPYTFTVSSGTLPANLTLSSTGLLSGTPSGSNSVSNFTSQVTDNNGCSSYKSFAVVLPLGILAFDAQNNNNTVSLQWKASTEKGCDYYTVERSDDARNFAAIGTVKANANPDIEQTYRFTDPAKISGMTYYRLKLVLTDGDYGYTSVLAVKDQNGSYTRPPFALLSHPAVGAINLQLTTGAATQLKAFDVQGRCIYATQAVAGDRLSIPLPAGIYILNAYSSDNSMLQSEKIIVD